MKFLFNAIAALFIINFVFAKLDSGAAGARSQPLSLQEKPQRLSAETERLAQESTDQATDSRKQDIENQAKAAVPDKQKDQAAKIESRKRKIAEEAKSGILAKMKDPSSVQFRNVIVALDAPLSTLWSSATSTADLVCGEYNAKNSFGGYAGFEWFAWDSERKKYMMNELGSGESLGKLMNELAQKNCMDIAKLAAK